LYTWFINSVVSLAKKFPANTKGRPLQTYIAPGLACSRIPVEGIMVDMDWQLSL